MVSKQKVDFMEMVISYGSQISGKIDGENDYVQGGKMELKRHEACFEGRCHDVWHLFDKMMWLDLLFYHFLSCLYIFVATISRNYTKELCFSVSPKTFLPSLSDFTKKDKLYIFFYFCLYFYFLISFLIFFFYFIFFFNFSYYKKITM